MGDSSCYLFTIQQAVFFLQKRDFSKAVYLKESEVFVADQHTDVLVRVLVVILWFNLPVSENLSYRFIKALMVTPPLFRHVIDRDEPVVGKHETAAQIHETRKQFEVSRDSLTKTSLICITINVDQLFQICHLIQIS